MFKALSDGHRVFRRIAIVADTPVPTAPCGPCRQILWEYGGDLDVILANLDEETGRHRLRELLPVPFDAETLRSGGSRAGLKAGTTGDAVKRRRR
jgi:cytidine deaminase